MADFNVRSDAVNVEQIMEQIRARIREKRGVDYTEEQIRELASVKLEKFLDPRGVRSDLLEQFRRAQPPYTPPELPNYAFEADTLFDSTRGSLRWIRKLLLPILKLFFNPNPLIQALNIQSRLNASQAEREAKRDAARYAFDQLHYEVMHNLVLETTRLGIEVKNLKMRIESLASRLEFNERRARALESVVVYKPSPEERSRDDERRRDDGRRQEGRRQERQPAAAQSPVEQKAAVPEPAPTPEIAPEAADAATPAEGPGQKSRRRRRRRGRRGGGSAAAVMGAASAEETISDAESDQDQGGEESEPDLKTTAVVESPALPASELPALSVSESPAIPASDSAALPASESVAPHAPETPALAGPEADALPEAAEDTDTREVRPEPIEHTFGATTHPDERAASDPTHTVPPEANPPAETTTTPEADHRDSSDPSATPEQ